MMKRGISPLIGWVVLVGFAVAAGLLVTQWAIQQFQDIDLPDDKEGYCDSVEIELDSICLKNNGHEVDLTIKNEGAFTITIATFGRQIPEDAKSWCIDLLNPDITPDTISGPLTYEITANSGDYEHMYATQPCEGLSQGQDENGAAVTVELGMDIVTIEFVPWINIEGDDFACYDKRIILNSQITEECT